MHRVRPHAGSAQAALRGGGLLTGDPPIDPERSGLVALYLRVAEALETSAQLAEEHARRERDRGREFSADVELDNAQRAREAARRGRDRASRLT